jgi:hypothetical protein
MTVWRTKINSERPDLYDDRPGSWDRAKKYCRDASVVGIGWGLPGVLADRASLEEVLTAVTGVPDWSTGGPQTIRRLATQVEEARQNRVCCLVAGEQIELAAHLVTSRVRARWAEAKPMPRAALAASVRSFSTRRTCPRVARSL